LLFRGRGSEALATLQLFDSTPSLFSTTARERLEKIIRMVEKESNQNHGTLGRRTAVVTAEKLRTDYLKGDLNGR